MAERLGTRRRLKPAVQAQPAKNHGRDGAAARSILAALLSGRHDRLETVDLLLSVGANVHQRGFSGYTPLHHAASDNDPTAIALLLAHGADLNARTRIDDYATPLGEAEMLGRADAVRAATERAKQRGGDEKG